MPASEKGASTTDGDNKAYTLPNHTESKERNKRITLMPANRKGHFTKDGITNGLQERIGIFYLYDQVKNTILTSTTRTELRYGKHLGKDPSVPASGRR